MVGIGMNNVLSNVEMNTVINTILGVAAVVVPALPLSRKPQRYMDFPFGEYDTVRAATAAKLTKWLWKTNWIISMITVFILLFELTRKEGEFNFNISDAFFRKSLLSIIAVELFTSLVKEIFHNKLSYTVKAESVFKKHFDTLNNLYWSVFMESCLLLMLGFRFIMLRRKYESLFCLLIISSLFFCFFRISCEMIDFLHLRMVEKLSVKMVDGNNYQSIKEFNDLGNTIRIVSDDNMVSYLSKDNIINIDKKIDDVRVIDIVRDKSKRKSNKERKNKESQQS